MQVSKPAILTALGLASLCVSVRVRAGPRFGWVRAFGVVALVAAASLSHAEAASSAPNSSSSPAFSAAFSRSALPPGEFYGWCGLNDKFLMRHGHEVKLYDRGAKQLGAFPIKPGTLKRNISCDDAEVILYTNEAAEIVTFDWRTQGTDEILKYDRARFPSPILALSPSRKYAAYRADGAQGKPLMTPSGMHFLPVAGGDFHWKGDSSKLFAILRGEPGVGPRNYQETVIVYDPATGAETRGKLPQRLSFYDSVAFVDHGAELMLFLKPGDEGDGAVYRCRIKEFQCKAVVSRVRTASMSESGELVLVRWLYKRPPPSRADDQIVLPDRYAVEIFRPGEKPMLLATFSPLAHALAVASISPSGRTAVAQWLLIEKMELQCRGKLDSTPCKEGAVFELNQ